MARPTKLTRPLGAKISQALAGGDSLRAICKPAKMPDKRTVLRWIFNPDPSELELWFRGEYRLARQVQAELLAEEIVELADEAKNAESMPEVAGCRLRVDSRKWIASKLLPKVYGDRLELETPDLKPGTFPPLIITVQGEK